MQSSWFDNIFRISLAIARERYREQFDSDAVLDALKLVVNDKNIYLYRKSNRLYLTYPGSELDQVSVFRLRHSEERGLYAV